MTVDTFQPFLYMAQGGKHSSYFAKLCRAFWLLILGTHTYFAVWKIQILRRRKTSSIYWLNYLLARSTAMYFDHFSSGLPFIHTVSSAKLMLWSVSLNAATTAAMGRSAKRLWKLADSQDIDKTSISSIHSKPSSKAYMQYRRYWAVFYGKVQMAPTNLQARVNMVYCIHFHLDL